MGEENMREKSVGFCFYNIAILCIGKGAQWACLAFINTFSNSLKSVWSTLRKRTAHCWAWHWINGWEFIYCYLWYRDWIKQFIRVISLDLMGVRYCPILSSFYRCWNRGPKDPVPTQGQCSSSELSAVLGQSAWWKQLVRSLGSCFIHPHPVTLHTTVFRAPLFTIPPVCHLHIFTK